MDCFTAVLLQKNCKLKGRYPANIYLFKVSNRSTWKRWELYLKLRVKTSEWRDWRRSGVFIVEFEHISHCFSSASIAEIEQVNISSVSWCKRFRTGESWIIIRILFEVRNWIVEQHEMILLQCSLSNFKAGIW